MTQAKWEDPAIDGFLVTVSDGLTIRIDRRQHIAEMRNGGGTLIGTIRHQPG
jgi:hypothetical protein